MVDSAKKSRKAGKSEDNITELPGGVRFDNRKSFKQQVDEIVKNKGESDTSHVLVSENTPKILIDLLKWPNLPVIMDSSHIYSVSVTKERAIKDGKFSEKENYHNMKSKLKLIPKEIEKPLMIIKSYDNDNNLDIVEITSLIDNDGYPVIIAFKVNSSGYIYGKYTDANRIKSIYGKEYSGYGLQAIYDDRVLYVDKTRSQDIRSIPRVQFPSNIINLDFSDNLTRYVDNVNRLIYNKKNTQHSYRDNNASTSESDGNVYRFRDNSYYEGIKPCTRKEALKLKMIDNRNLVRYRKEIDGVFNGEMQERQVVLLGKPSEVLVQNGIADKPLTISQDVIRKIVYPEKYVIGDNKMQGKHNLGISVVKNLPYQLYDPMMITLNTDKEGHTEDSRVVWTNWKTDKGESIIAVVKINKDGQIELDNRIVTVFNGRDDYLKQFIDVESKILYKKIIKTSNI